RGSGDLAGGRLESCPQDLAEPNWKGRAVLAPPRELVSPPCRRRGGSRTGCRTGPHTHCKESERRGHRGGGGEGGRSLWNRERNRTDAGVCLGDRATMTPSTAALEALADLARDLLRIDADEARRRLARLTDSERQWVEEAVTMMGERVSSSPGRGR